MSRLHLFVRETAAPTIALLTSLSTLICCTLPAIMITLGLGASLAALNSQLPILIDISAQKELVFIGSLVLLLIAALIRFLTRNLPCPADPAQARLCTAMRKLGGYVLWAGFAVWLIGAFSAFILPKILF